MSEDFPSHLGVSNSLSNRDKMFPVTAREQQGGQPITLARPSKKRYHAYFLSRADIEHTIQFMQQDFAAG